MISKKTADNIKKPGLAEVKIDYPFIRPYFLEPHILAIGITEGEIDNNKVRIYDKDRTICDCLKYLGKMDKEVFNRAIQSYIRDEKKSIPNLLNYAKQLWVHKKVKDLVECGYNGGYRSIDTCNLNISFQ